VDNLKTAWLNGGDFSKFPPAIENRFKSLYNSGYKLVISEPKISISGKNLEPDILFFGQKDIGGGVLIDDIQYLEIKYIEDVSFNTGGQKTLYDAVKNNGQASVNKVVNSNIVDVFNNPLPAKWQSNFDVNLVEKLTVKFNLDLVINP